MEPSGRKDSDSQLGGQRPAEGGHESPFRVNFLVIGAQKAGTTALASFLAQHPDICLAPCKEVHFFDHPEFDRLEKEGVHLSLYRQAFPNFSGQPVVGEATPIYAFWPWSATRIFRHNPDVKLIFLIRNPSERALSQYSMEKSRGTETKSFLECVLLEPLILLLSRKDQSMGSKLRTSSYISRGDYRKQVERFLKYFPRENIRLVQTEDLRKDHYRTLSRIFHFLGVADVSKDIPPKTVFSGERPFGRVELILRQVLRLTVDFRYRRFKKHFSDMLV